MRRWNPRAPARAGHDAGVAQRSRPSALPRFPSDAVRRRRRVSGDPRTPVSAVARLRAAALAPGTFLYIALSQLLALWLIVGTGAAVRLTDSGLGCRHWPGCEAGQPLPAKDAHAFVEFGNRLVGGVTIALTLITWLAARRTVGLPSWVVRLAGCVFLGTLAQAPLGLLAVASDLRWPVVMAHLLLSIALLGGATFVALEARGAQVGQTSRSSPWSCAASAWCSRPHASRSSSAARSNRRRAALRRRRDGRDRQVGRLEPIVYVHGAVVGIFLLTFLFSLGYLAARRERAHRLFASPSACSYCCSSRWVSASCSGERSCRGGSCSSTSSSPRRSGSGPLRSQASSGTRT